MINEGTCADLPQFVEFPFDTTYRGISTTAGAHHRLLERSVIGDWYVMVPQETFETELASVVRAEVVLLYTAVQP